MASDARGGAVDFAYLEGFLGDDRTVIAEVLALFVQQAESWAAPLAAGGPGWGDLVHTIKGASRGIGANALGDACARAEGAGPSETPAVRAALDAVLAEIAAYQASA